MRGIKLNHHTKDTTGFELGSEPQVILCFLNYKKKVEYKMSMNISMFAKNLRRASRADWNKMRQQRHEVDSARGDLSHPHTVSDGIRSVTESKPSSHVP